MCIAGCYLPFPPAEKINKKLTLICGGCALWIRKEAMFFFFFIQATKPNIDRTAQESLNYFFCETVNQRSLSTALNLKNKQTRTPRKKKWNNRSNEKQQGGSSREVGSYRIRTQYLFSTPKLVDDFRELSQVSMWLRVCVLLETGWPKRA